MKKIGKLLMALLVISVGLNIASLIYIAKLKKSITSDSLKERTSQKDDGNMQNQQIQDTSSIEKEIKEDLLIWKIINDQRPTFKMLNAMPIDYVGKKLILCGMAEISDSYYGGYHDATTSYYSVSLRNFDYDGISIYFLKSDNKKLFEILGQAESRGVPLRVKAELLESKYKSGSPYLAEGLSWEVLK